MWRSRIIRTTECYLKKVTGTTTVRHPMSSNDAGNHRFSPWNSYKRLSSPISSSGNATLNGADRFPNIHSYMDTEPRRYNSESIQTSVDNKYKSPIISLSSSAFQLLSHFLQSPRQVAKLEESLIKFLAENVQDPVFQDSIPPKFRSVAFSSEDNIIEVLVTLRSNTRLHPAIPELSSRIQKNALEEISNTINNFNKHNTGTAKFSFGEEKNNIKDTVSDGYGIKVRVRYDPSNTNKPLPWINANTLQEHNQYISKIGPGLRNVAHTVAVYSCKGGVGKSTVAVNLAYELAHMGARVGLLDVDIYGPSLPVLVKPKDQAVRRSPLGKGMVKPIEHEGVKVMSLGFVSPNSGVPGSGPVSEAAIMRGPMAGRVTTQLLKGTDWGCLDILLLDLPPGTGDVQMTVCQEMGLSGAIAVTTPSKLAVIDARKGIDMFRSMGVTTLAAVENMAFFTCDGGKKHYPFGNGLLADSTAFFEEELELKRSNVFQLPISENTNASNDNGSPFCLSRTVDSASEISVFENLAKALATELILLQNGKGETSEHTQSVTLDNENHANKYDLSSLQLTLEKEEKSLTVRLFSETGATQLSIKGKNLRIRDPKTGILLEEERMFTEENKTTCNNSNQINLDHYQHNHSKFIPNKIDKKGHYGYEVEFSDGATIIYSMLSVAIAAGAKLLK